VSPRHFTKLLYGPYFIEDKHYNKKYKNKIFKNFFIRIKKAKKRFGNNK
jgi:hypothetical protein